jgi:hypothetical protein
MATSKLDSLLPCPFCGEIPFTSGKPNGNFAICTNAGCPAWRQGSGYSVEEWNTRPLEDALNEQIRLQNELIEKLEGALGDLWVRTNKNDYLEWLQDKIYYAETAYTQWKEGQKE